MKKYIQFIIIDSHTKKQCFISKKKEFFSILFQKNIKYYKIKKTPKYNFLNKNKKYPIIILISTIHTSKKSSLFIYNLFKNYFPTDIAIEFCPERFFKKKIYYSNYITYILYLLLFNIQKQLSLIYNEIFGIDIIKSIFLSEKYNCNLYLIDKKITSTFKSLSKKISLIEIFYLLFIFLNLKYSKKLKLKLKYYYDDIENKDIKMINKIILFIKKNIPSYY